MNRTKRVILIIGFSVIAVTFIMLIVEGIYTWTHLSDPLDKRAMPFVYYLLWFPSIGEEFVLLRFVYQLVNTELRGFAKVCSFISAVMAFCALMFQVFALTGIITAADLFPEGPKSADDPFILLLILTGRPIIILSLILMGVGEWKDRKRKNTLTENSLPI